MKDYPERSCKACSKNFKPRRSHQHFCSKTCRVNFYALEYYHKHKNNTIFLERQRINRDTYRSTNPAYRIKRREWEKVYRAKIAAQRLPLGLCVVCGNKREDIEKKRCNKCLAKLLKYYRDYLMRKHEQHKNEE